MLFGIIRQLFLEALQPVYERVSTIGISFLTRAHIRVRARFGEYFRSKRKREHTRAHTRVTDLSKKGYCLYLMTPAVCWPRQLGE